MNARVSRWLYGVVSAFIQGGAGAVVASVTVAAIDPEKFNPMVEILNFIELAAAVFIINGVVHFFMYLQAHPLPDQSTGNTETITKP